MSLLFYASLISTAVGLGIYCRSTLDLKENKKS